MEIDELITEMKKTRLKYDALSLDQILKIFEIKETINLTKQLEMMNNG